MLKKIRRVVSGQRDGKSAIIFDAGATNAHSHPEVSEMGMTILWKTDENPVDNSGMKDRAGSDFEVRQSDHSTEFMVFHCPPYTKVLAASATKGRAAYFNDDLIPEGTQYDASLHPGMHQHDTCDYLTVVSGTITFIVETGEVTLYAGDTLVNRGSMHAWENRGDEVAILTSTSVAAKSTSD